MQITHLQSSTQIIQIGGIRILTDPWLADGEYYGSWYHYPPFNKDEILSLNYDYIYVSHIHPDHLSEKTFRTLPSKKPVLIHNYESKFVKRKLEMLGYEVIECENGEPFRFNNGASITIFAADNCDPKMCGKFMGCGAVEEKFGSTQIDTLAKFEYGDCIALNTNDCPFELASKTIIANGLNCLKIDLLLVGYAGAGPYPQCFEFENVQDKLKAAKLKELQFLEKAKQYIELLQPITFAPFAGTYVLGSRLSSLNEYRGVPLVSEATEALNVATSNKHNGVHLERFDTYDCITKTLKKNINQHTTRFEDYIAEISGNPLEYDDDEWNDEDLLGLLKAAHERFNAKAEEINFKSQTKLIIRSNKIAFQISVGGALKMLDVSEAPVAPFVRIDVDHNLLHRLLRGPRYAHWNNAEIGSHLRYLRVPDVFERGLYYCMCFLHA